MPPRTSTSSSKRRVDAAPDGRPRKRARADRSVWNSADDWNTLIAEASLSTSSISTRPPRPKGLHTLVKCATDAAVRGFKRAWEAGGLEVEGEIVIGPGRVWKLAWSGVADHLKIGVRDGVFRLWGSYLTLGMITELFLVPPSLFLPGALLPVIAKLDRLKPLRPPEGEKASYSSLVLTHAPAVTDVAIAGLIHNLTHLEVVNLKGCSLAGAKTVEALVKRCGKLRRINLKGTKVLEAEVKQIFDAFNDQLQGFKVEDVRFEHLDGTFAAAAPCAPHLTHLCLPGDMINGASTDYRARALLVGRRVAYPNPKPARQGTEFDWVGFPRRFPAVTHLYLPFLLVPPGTSISPLRGLVKLSLGLGGPPVPVATVAGLVCGSRQTLRTLHIGHILPEVNLTNGNHDNLFWPLEMTICECEQVEDFRLEMDPGGSGDQRCDQAMAKYSDKIYTSALRGPWRRSLKHLSLAVSQAIDPAAFLPADNCEANQRSAPVLERLELPSANIRDTASLAANVAKMPHLRSLDVSGSSITGQRPSLRNPGRVCIALEDRSDILSRSERTEQAKYLSSLGSIQVGSMTRSVNIGEAAGPATVERVQNSFAAAA